MSTMAWVYLGDLIRFDSSSEAEVKPMIEYRRRKAKARFYADENTGANLTFEARPRGTRVVEKLSLRVGDFARELDKR